MLARMASIARPVVVRGGARKFSPSVVPLASGVRCYHEATHNRSENLRHVGFVDKEAVDVGIALVGKAGPGANVEDGEQAIQVAMDSSNKKHKSIRDHFINPRNIGRFDRKAMDVGAALIGKKSQGGVIRMHILVRDGVIEDAKFKAVGCASVIACSSCATEMIIGKRVDEAEILAETAISSHLKLSSAKAHCSVLATEAVQAAIANFKAKHAIVRSTSIAPSRHAGASTMGLHFAWREAAGVCKHRPTSPNIADL